MKRISPHFTLEEFCVSGKAKALGLNNTPDPEQEANLTNVTAPALERVRAEVFGGHSLEPHSVFRSVPVNHAVGGQEPTPARPNRGYSYHTFGLAVDFDPPPGMTHNQCQHAIAELPNFSFDLVMEEGTALPESQGGSRWIHLQFPKPGETGRRLVRDALVDRLGGTITRTSPG